MQTDLKVEADGLSALVEALVMLLTSTDFLGEHYDEFYWGSA